MFQVLHAYQQYIVEVDIVYVIKLIFLGAFFVVYNNNIPSKILHLSTLWFGVIISGTYQIGKIFMGHYYLGVIISGPELFIF